MSGSKVSILLTTLTGPDPRKFRLWLFLGAWLIAYFVISPFAIFAIQLLPFFPIGLFGLSSGNNVTTFIVGGWLLYLGYGMAHFLNPSRVLFYILYAIFFVALMFNAAGCHSMLGELPLIH